MADSMTFTLVGRDHLSRVLNNAGRAARDMNRDIEESASRSDDAISRFTRDASGRLRDARGRFVSAGEAARLMGDDVDQGTERGRGGLARLIAAMRDVGGGSDHLRAKLLAVGVAATIPAAAVGAVALAQFAASAGAAAVAVGAFGLAIIPQVSQIKSVVTEQAKYQKEVAKSGASSAKSAEAQMKLVRASAKLNKPTKVATAAFLSLTAAYKEWSNNLSDDTMPVLTHGFETLNGLLPKLSPTIRGASGELDRFVSILAGGMNTSSFDRVMAKFADFSTGSLRRMNDGLVHFIRISGDFDGSSIDSFLSKVREYGPVVTTTLGNVGDALAHVISAGGDMGVIVLKAVNAVANAVASIPTGVLSTLLQLYTMFRLVSIGAAGLSFVVGKVGRMRVGLTGLTTAAAGSAGALGGLRAAFLSLSTKAKATVVVAAVTALVVVLSKLSSIGKSAPPDVDKLSTSLKELGKSGKVAGEAARVFGSDLSGLSDALDTLARPSNLDKTQQFLTSLIGMDSTPVKEAKEKFDGLDDALTNLVKGGKADLAAAALKHVIDGMKAAGRDTSGARKQLDGYRSALKDMKLEQQLAADSMGLFGQQARKTQEKLDAQKASADGLRQSIQALNDAQRKGLGGMIGFEAAIDDAAKAAKENAGSLRMVHGQLDLNSSKARDAASALQDLASKTDEAASNARESGKSWSEVNGIYSRGRSELIRTAKQMGLTGAEAKKLADQILQVPDKKVIFEGNLEDLKAKILDATKRVHDAPASKLTRLQGNISDLQEKLNAAKRGIKSVPESKRSHIRGEISDLQKKLAQAKRELAALHNKTVTVTTVFRQVRRAGGSNQAAKNFYETRAHGGPVPGYASGGHVQALQAGGYVRGPGSATSDSIYGVFGNGVAKVSNREYVVQAQAVRKYGVDFFDSLNAMQVPRLPNSATTETQRGAETHNTWNVYPQQVNFTVHDLEAMQARADVRARVGRPR